MNEKLNISRRDFLKLLSLLPLTYFLPAQSQKLFNSENISNQKNILILVFDALSASNMSLYGYPRNTTPKLLEITKQAIVYHKHYSGGSFTTPGTASLLTGTYPWTHRAIKLGDEVINKIKKNNIFNAFPSHHRFAYTQNIYADILLNQFQDDIDNKENLWEFFLSTGRVISHLFPKDLDALSIVDNATFNPNNQLSYSLFLTRLIKYYLDQKRRGAYKGYRRFFPRGFPNLGKDSQAFFVLEDTIDWLKNTIETIQRPFLGYIHVLPPHDPYKTRKEFYDIFNDGWYPPAKPRSVFQSPDYSEDRLRGTRILYDEYIPYVDAEFSRLFEFLDREGFLEDTIVMFTTDHGEIFERGVLFHGHPLMYEPAIHIPLVIFHPDQNERIDVVSPNSAVDILPTLLYETGQPIPAWCEGEVLPPFNKTPYPSDRSIYSMDAKKNPSPKAPFSIASGMIVNWNYKLTHYFGYPDLPNGEPIIELFDLDNDPEELENLYPEKKSLAKDLLHELISRMEEADEPYK